MNRSDKITRLCEAGFSATELSRMGNPLLDATYAAAQPLLAAKKEEVRRVVNRENRHSQRRKQELAQQQSEHQREVEWNRKWKPLPPICSMKRDVNQYAELIRGHKQDHETNKALFRKTGHRRYAEAATASLRVVRHLEGQLVHIACEEIK